MSFHYKKVSAFVYEGSDADHENDAEGILKIVDEYDSNGHMLSHRVYDDEGNPEESVQCTYNNDGRLESERIHSYMDDQGQIRTITYNNEMKQIKEKIEYDSGGTTNMISFFNEKGLPEKIEHYYGESDLEKTETFLYDGNDRLIKHTIEATDKDAQAEETYLYESDKISINRKNEDGEITEIQFLKNNLPELIQFFQDDNCISEIGREYDDKARLVKETVTELETLVTEREFRYDDKGNRVYEEIRDHRYRRFQRTEREFNSDGLLSTESFFSTFGNASDYSLRFVYE
jgi:antitoxin component YwqK of YwqJK toxin-antitoxin module